MRRNGLRSRSWLCSAGKVTPCGLAFGETQRRLLSSLPNVEGVVLAGVNHAMSIQDPAAVAVALAAFYRRHPLSR